jgi:hypothetical protein
MAGRAILLLREEWAKPRGRRSRASHCGARPGSTATASWRQIRQSKGPSGRVAIGSRPRSAPALMPFSGDGTATGTRALSHAQMRALRHPSKRQGQAVSSLAATAKRARKRPIEHRAARVLKSQWQSFCGQRDLVRTQAQAFEQRRETIALCDAACRWLQGLASKQGIHREHYLREGEAALGLCGLDACRAVFSERADVRHDVSPYCFRARDHRGLDGDLQAGGDRRRTRSPGRSAAEDGGGETLLAREEWPGSRATCRVGWSPRGRKSHHRRCGQAIEAQPSFGQIKPPRGHVDRAPNSIREKTWRASGGRGARVADTGLSAEDIAAV